jgi:type II restriction enzyme
MQTQSQIITQSDRLSLRQTRDGGGASINNEEARCFDNQLKKLVPNNVLPILTERYPDINFTHIKKINQSDYASIINPDYVPLSNNPFITPDGGIILANGNPVFIGEAKKQGTNNDRIARGLPRQACGNAIERAFKNYNELKAYMFDKDYFPYLLFVYGSDFEQGCSILSRLHSMTMFKPYNNLYINDNNKIASIFVQVEPYTDEFIIDKCLEAVEISMNHLQLI